MRQIRDGKKYKIAYILTSVAYGGLEKVSSCLLQKYDRNKFDIYPILFVQPWQKENKFVLELIQSGLRFYEIPVALHPRDQGRDVFRIPRCYRLLYNILKRESFDLVHTNGTLADIISIPVAKLLGLATISTCHGLISIDKKLVFYNFLNRLVLRLCTQIISVSEAIKKDLMESGINESRVKVIQNAVQTNPTNDLNSHLSKKKISGLGFIDNDFVLGFVGRLSEEKGIKNLIKAVLQLIDAGVQIKLLLIGEGPQRKELEEWVRGLNVPNRIIFAGFRRDIDNILPSIDVFILPSLTEGTPMSLLEAMACGIPVVASAVGGIPQVIVSGKNGLLVSPGKPEEIADAVSLLYHNEILRKTLAEEARATIKLKYNTNDWVRKVEAEYLKIILRETK